ncbi:hypothetical protein MXB_5255 [Myxobolus squamalis]|nr:hypothetical protein MXB_5255 [Myxobolus squamalis]
MFCPYSYAWFHYFYFCWIQLFQILFENTSMIHFLKFPNFRPSYCCVINVVKFLSMQMTKLSQIRLGSSCLTTNQQV